MAPYIQIYCRIDMCIHGNRGLTTIYQISNKLANYPGLWVNYIKEFSQIQNVSPRSKTYRSTRSKTYLQDLSSFLRKLKSEQHIVFNKQGYKLKDCIYQRCRECNVNISYKISKLKIASTRSKTYLRDCISEFHQINMGKCLDNFKWL